MSLAIDRLHRPSLAVASLLFVVALAALVWSSDRFVSAVEEVGFAIGVSPFIIGATVVVAGTSLPELVPSVLGVMCGAPAIVVGNVLGSNVFYTFGVMEVASLFGPLTVPGTIRSYALPVMILATVLCYFIVQDHELTR